MLSVTKSNSAGKKDDKNISDHKAILTNNITVKQHSGKRYKIFFSDYADTSSISDNIIIDLVEDDEQNLWIAGFYQGLSKYNLKTGKIKRYSRLSDDITPGYGVNSILKDHDNQILEPRSVSTDKKLIGVLINSGL